MNRIRSIWQSEARSLETPLKKQTTRERDTTAAETFRGINPSIISTRIMYMGERERKRESVESKIKREALASVQDVALYTRAGRKPSHPVSLR